MSGICCSYEPSLVRRRLRVAEVKAAYSDPRLWATVFGEVGKVSHQGDVVLVRRNKTECIWVNESEGKEQMGVSFGVKVLWRNTVTLAGPHVPRLIVTDGSPL